MLVQPFLLQYNLSPCHPFLMSWFQFDDNREVLQIVALCQRGQLSLQTTPFLWQWAEWLLEVRIGCEYFAIDQSQEFALQADTVHFGSGPSVDLVLALGAVSDVGNTAPGITAARGDTWAIWPISPIGISVYRRTDWSSSKGQLIPGYFIFLHGIFAI